MSIDDREKDEKSARSGGDGAALVSPGSTTLARARPTVEQHVVIVDHTIGLLASGYPPRDAAAQLRKDKGVSRATSYRYVAIALKRLTSDEVLEPIESRRARHRAMLERRIRKAETMKRTGVTNGETYEYDSPDLGAANAAQALLAKIDGVLD